MKDLNGSANVHVGTHIRIPSNATTSIGISYQYNTGSVQTKSAIVPIPSLSEPTWVYISHSFDISDVPLGNYQQRIAFTINFDGGGTDDEYTYYINGITVGQDAENLASECLGKGGAYTVGSLNGGESYLSVKKSSGLLTAVQDGIPLHYGLSYGTLLKPYIPEQPSMLMYNSGFLNEGSRTKTKTLEFWLKVGRTPQRPVRIVGPDGYTDGLYVHNTSLVLSISGTEVGYDLGTIDYPMLIDWVVSSTNSQVMVNGETVIDIDSPPDTSYMLDNTAIGFYTDKAVHPLYVSSIAAYPYPVPSVVAKTRFVRGQGTIQYGLIAEEFDGKSHSADFSTSNFGVNVSYPDNVRWSSGYAVNVGTGSQLSAPAYSVPEVMNASDDQSWSFLNKEMTSRPSTSVTRGNTTPLDASNDNTSGTAFTTSASMGAVYTSGGAASSCTNTISIQSDIPYGAKVKVSGRGKFIGTAPQLRITFVGPNVTYNTTFASSDNTPYTYKAEAEYEIPVGTTSITWGIAVGAGMTTGQFDNVFIQFSYGNQPFYLIPDGYDTSPILNWGSIDILQGQKTAAVTSTMIFDSSPTEDTILMSVSRRGTATQLVIYLNDSGEVVYEYSDYTGSTVLSTTPITAGKQFTIGFHVSDIVETYPLVDKLFSQPAETEVAVGSGGVFEGKVCDVSFHNAWSASQLSHTYTNGLADMRTQATYVDPEISSYTLHAVTDYGNFTLDVAAFGYWQTTFPLSLFTTTVKDRFGDDVQRIDFIQANIGKSRASMDVLEHAPLTYFQLQNNYWGRAYSSLDYADYAELASQTYPVHDVSKLDCQTWIAMQSLSDPVVDYTKKDPVPVDGQPVVYLDNDSRRHLIQDGYSIVLPYTYDIEKYALVVYHLVSTSGFRSSPTKLKSFELASWASDATSWRPMVSKEGNDVYPYVHNGAFFVNEYPNVFEVTKRGYNYLYKSSRSGYKPRTLDLPGYNSGLMTQWSRSGSAQEEREFAGYSMFVMYESEEMVSETLISILSIGNDTLFNVYAVPLPDSDRYKIVARKADGTPFTNLQWYVNGRVVTTPMFDTQEWYMLQCALPEPYDAAGVNVNLMMTGNGMSFDNITLNGRLKANVRGVAVYRRWDELFENSETWDYWRLETDNWQTLYDLGAVLSVDIEQDRMYTMLTGVPPKAQFSSSFGTEFKEIFVIRDIEWVPVDVITK